MSFCQSSYTQQIRWGNKNLNLTIINNLPQEGDSIVGLKPFQLRFLNQQLIALIKYKEIADSTISEQNKTIIDLNLISDNHKKQIENLETINKQTKRTWMKRGLGIGAGGICVGTILGLIIPTLID